MSWKKEYRIVDGNRSDEKIIEAIEGEFYEMPSMIKKPFYKNDFFAFLDRKIVIYFNVKFNVLIKGT